MNSKKLLDIEELLKVASDLKTQGKKLVFTNGCFDLLHPGHVRYLEKARQVGDVLIVGINSDRSVRELKGSSRPIFPEDERAEILAAFAVVDFVIIFDEPTPRELIARLQPQVLVKGGDWGSAQIVGREEVEAAGGKVISLKHHPGHSTSRLIETIVGNAK